MFLITTKEYFTRSKQKFDLLLDIAGSRPWRETRRVRPF
jgi:hypothetical protein